jgi:hypothetical protein
VQYLQLDTREYHHYSHQAKGWAEDMVADYDKKGGQTCWWFVSQAEPKAVRVEYRSFAPCGLAYNHFISKNSNNHDSKLNTHYSYSIMVSGELLQF